MASLGGGFGKGRKTASRTSRPQHTPQQLQREQQAYSKYMLGKSEEWGGGKQESTQEYTNRMAAKKTFAKRYAQQMARKRKPTSLDAQLQGLKR